MDILKTLFSTSGAIYLVVVPILRELSAVFLAIAISKDCKARYNKNNILWAIFTLLSPVFVGIIYFIYSRVINKCEKQDISDKKIKSAKKLTVLAIIIYVISVILCIVSFSTIIGTEIYSQVKDNSSLMFNDSYYDINGNEYENATDVPLYDQDGNKYVIKKVNESINWYAYFDELGNQYELEDSYISKDGCFYYDDEQKLEHKGKIVTTDTIFYDEQGNEYVAIGQYAYFDNDGNIIHKFDKYEDVAFD
jgi:heme/copper-type cytochrome/quinol oxidase subunit 2